MAETSKLSKGVEWALSGSTIRDHNKEAALIATGTTFMMVGYVLARNRGSGADGDNPEQPMLGEEVSPTELVAGDGQPEVRQPEVC